MTTLGSTPAESMTASSTGFELYEKLVAERRSKGKSATLEKWLTETRQRLEEFRKANPSAKAQKEAAAVEQACQRAAELAETLAKIQPIKVS